MNDTAKEAREKADAAHMRAVRLIACNAPHWAIRKVEREAARLEREARRMEGGNA